MAQAPERLLPDAEGEGGATRREAEARTREILGSPPRLEPPETPENDRDLTEIFTRLRDLYQLPLEAMPAPALTTLCHHPALFNAYFAAGLALMDASLLPARLRELAILRTGWLCGAPYQWGEHLDSAHEAGLTEADVDRITRGSAAPGWTEPDRTVLQAAEELHAGAMIADTTWAALAKHLDPPQLVELLVLIGHYTQTAYIQNSLRFIPRDCNPGLAGR